MHFTVKTNPLGLLLTCNLYPAYKATQQQKDLALFISQHFSSVAELAMQTKAVESENVKSNFIAGRQSAYVLLMTRADKS